MPGVIEQAFYGLLLCLPVFYYIASFAKTSFSKWCRKAARNHGAYALIFEDAVALFFFAGLLGSLLLYYPNLEATLGKYGVDVLETVERLRIAVTIDMLRQVRLCILGLGGWYLLLGLLTATLGRRDRFEDVREAVRYFVHVRRTLVAATYVATVGPRIVSVPEVDDPKDLQEWEGVAERTHDYLTQLDGAFRRSRQGGNVRVVLEIPGRNLHYWRFGTHAYLVAELRERGALVSWVRFLLRRTPEEEFRALVASIRAIASVHGA